MEVLQVCLNISQQNKRINVVCLQTFNLLLSFIFPVHPSQTSYPFCCSVLFCKSVRVCASLCEIVWVCVRLCEFVWDCTSLCEFVWECASLCEIGRVCVNLCEFTFLQFLCISSSKEDLLASGDNWFFLVSASILQFALALSIWIFLLNPGELSARLAWCAPVQSHSAAVFVCNNLPNLHHAWHVLYRCNSTYTAKHHFLPRYPGDSCPPSLQGNTGRHSQSALPARVTEHHQQQHTIQAIEPFSAGSNSSHD